MDISSIAAIIKTITELKKWNDKIKDSQFQFLLSDLLDNISNLKIEIANLKEENVSLKGENLNLKSQLSIKEDVIYNIHSAVYFKRSDIERKEPFCPVCYDNQGKLNHLFDIGSTAVIGCKVCSTNFRMK